jgi:cbb3-type cytochrome oxidase subunit 3
MKQEILKHFPEVWMTLTALVLFMLIFVSVIYRIFRPSVQKEIENAANIPLNEGEKSR